MKALFDFSGREYSEKIIRETWSEFRKALTEGLFAFDEVEKAKKYTFLKVYDDLFNQHSAIDYKCITIRDLDSVLVGRGTILNATEIPDYERFIPKQEFITNDNRFSPIGVEWLYLAIGSEYDIHQCAQAECRAKTGESFGFCHFVFDKSSSCLKLVDLTIADDISYNKINYWLKKDYQKFKPKNGVNLRDDKDFVAPLKKWTAYIYTKLLSEQIFVPLCDTDDRSIMYAPFQTMAQYYISLGYSGIIYKSTVSDFGKNLVLFDKNIVHPFGTIEHYTLP